ncbi:MAG: hypothetical protein HFE44_09600 [Oscillospiraceae bacterium]|nr:hypothetical protein [Oscillospiraceae bacterium]
MSKPLSSRSPKSRAKASKRMSFPMRAAWCAALVFSGALIYQLAHAQVSIYRQQKVLEDLTVQCLNQKAENDGMNRYLIMEDDTQLVEQIAREKLGFAYPDEVVYIDAAGS